MNKQKVSILALVIAFALCMAAMCATLMGSMNANAEASVSKSSVFYSEGAELEKNIAFAKEKAQEVFQAGDIPICPHLMFPPFADPDDPAQDQAAREMGLRLVEHCQQVNVYGTVRTPGMLAEIRRAEELNIPVKADQPGLKKKKDRPRRGQIR